MFFYATRRSTQEFQNNSSSQAEEGKGGAMQDYEKDDKVSSDVRMGTDEYGEEREDEVRCHVRGGGRGEHSGLKKGLGGREA